jgi:hypothetical protein
MYGNIGSDSRLDFTVIGPAVNLTARIESMCRQLGRQLQGRRRRSGDIHADQPRSAGLISSVIRKRRHKSSERIMLK